jgi:hypothetical protein
VVAIDKSKLTWDDYRHFAMLPIFAKGIARFANQDPSSVYQSMLADGMTAVFRWWCQNGIPLPGEPDFLDVAAQVAGGTAKSLGFEDAEIQSTISMLAPKWLTYSCKTVPGVSPQPGVPSPAPDGRPRPASRRTRSRRR